MQYVLFFHRELLPIGARGNGSAYKEKQDRVDPAQEASIEFIRNMGRCYGHRLNRGQEYPPTIIYDVA